MITTATSSNYSYNYYGNYNITISDRFVGFVQLFSQYGQVLKIVTFTKNGKLFYGIIVLFIVFYCKISTHKMELV